MNRLAIVLVVGSLSALLGAACGGVDAADNLYFSEEDAGRIDLLVRTFKLAALPPVTASATQPVCVHVRRAPGFTGAITLLGGDGVRVLTQPGTGDGGEVLVTGCPAAGCSLTARAGSRSDLIWIRTR